MSVLSALYTSRKPAAAFVVVGLFWGCFAAFVPVLKAQLGANDAVFGTLLIGSATGLVSAMFLAPKADKILGARAMQVGIVLLSLAWLVPAQISIPLVFVFAMALVGAASGILDVVMNARVSELEAKTGRPLMNANHAMFSLAYAVAAVLTGFAREAGIPPIYVFAGFGCFSVLLVPFMQMDVTYVAAEDGYAGKYPLWPIVLCGLIVLMAFMSEATVEAWSALHVERTLGGGAAEGALGPAMLGFTMAFGRFSGQAISERFRDLTVVICASAIAATGAVIAALAPTPLVAYVGFGTLGLGVSVIGPIGLALVGKVVPPHLRTEAISRCAVIGFSGFFFAPMLMGLVSEAFGLRIAFLCVSVLLLMATPLALLAARLPQQNRV
ncbi:Major Facilitator Superfamily protein [Cognatiyoonia koreensis]|uniref:Major Facilitator Superfamily protein n=1 Tax=Cognatiyoonia koreensis TaxID=364200 RepID=A0A1I0MI96_9RHOB|nr:MFS transporter [Cognatiyoonia koreensis]SEV87490.1 Major Facilitator Superfamily protein [Cognatiyoonia koreensis]